MQKFLVVVFFGLVFSFFSCKSKSSANEESAAVVNENPAGFDRFYERFHADSLYQMAHIQWPLRGMKVVIIDSTRSLGKGVFQPEEWTMHKPVDFASGQFRRDLLWLDSTFVTEYVRFARADYGLERQFAKSEGEWQLVFYQEMRELK